MTRVSTVVPVFNEEASLPELHRRLVAALDGAGMEFEAVFVDDGSTDGSAAALERLAAADPRVVVVRQPRNLGQHAAVYAGLAAARGAVVVTLDADLQDPPEAVPGLVRKAEEGHDLVAGRRTGRRGSWFRRAASHLVNLWASRATGVRLADCGCMLRAHRRSLVDAVLARREGFPFVPVLANSLAASVVEVPVPHAPRAHGRSRYGPRRLAALGRDLAAAVAAARARRGAPGPGGSPPCDSR